jgi:hypothetical protein
LFEGHNFTKNDEGNVICIENSDSRPETESSMDEYTPQKPKAKPKKRETK